MSNNSILVIGGGFAGITAALEAAEIGYDVIIVEKNPYLGGRVAQLNQYFPKMCPPSCGLEIQFQRIKNNPRVKFLTLAEVTAVSGSVGDYTVDVKISPRHVNEKCTCCGKCVDAAKTTVKSEFDLGVGERKTAYCTHLFAFPQRYVVDTVNASPAELKAIKDACPYDAVDLDAAEKTQTFSVGSIVMATGWQPYPLEKLENLGAGKLTNVISNMQMERLCAPSGPTNGVIKRPSDGAEPQRIAFVQCAGSRDQNHLNYCSYICCMASLKQVNYVKERNPSAKVTVFYIDLRTPGRYDKFKAMATENPNLSLVKGKVAGIKEDADKNPVVTVENAVTGIKSDEPFDLVVLATGMQPSIAGQKLPLTVARDDEGFITAEGDGIVAAGCAKLPLDVMKTAQTATGAALKAIQNVVGR
ncbi:MAG: CoB--CoM heterodisulfide reductase iron-sulfur subunit A family protein [Desulfovibrionaceae bacterium]|jgi:quinone-modifying oxidoreductase subunit QmoA